MSRRLKICLLVDTPNLEPLEPILDALEGQPIQAWIATSAFISLGPSVVHHLRLAGFDAHLDLRLTGEAGTVFRSVEALTRTGALGVTVDLGAGAQVARAAKQAARGRLEVIGVPGPLDQPELADRNLQIARDSGLKAIYVSRELAARSPTSARCYVRADDPVVGAAALVVGERLLAAPDPRQACLELLGAL